MTHYEIGILGTPTPEQIGTLSSEIEKMVGEFGLKLEEDVKLYFAEDINSRNFKVANVAVYFGNADHKDSNEMLELIDAKVPIIPVTQSADGCHVLLPAQLQPLNCLFLEDDESMTKLSSALLECLGLLHTQRRIFVSYRRIESRQAALQLHDLLSEKGFDVFLDTHDIRPGAPFQEMLWHTLCESDVMVMLDTATYFESKWTEQEFMRARAKEIHIFRVVWPNHTPQARTDLAETFYLDPADLNDATGPIAVDKANEIAKAVEYLRSKSIAARYLSITGKLTAAAKRVGYEVEGIGAHRAIVLTSMKGTKLLAYPVVGIPTALTLNDIYDKSNLRKAPVNSILVYDHVGISNKWMNHIDWLGEHIPSIKALKVERFAWELADVGY